MSASSFDEEALVAKRREIRAQQPSSVDLSSAASPTRSDLLLDPMRRSEDETSVVKRLDPLLPQLPMLWLLPEVECSNVGSLNPV